MYYIHYKLVHLSDVFTTDYYDQRAIGVAYAFTTAIVSSRRRFNAYFVICRSLKHLVERYEESRALFESLSVFACWYVTHHGGNIVIGCFSYHPLAPPNIPTGFRILGVKDTSLAFRMFSGCKIQNGDFDNALLISPPSLSKWRDACLSNGILTWDDLSQCINDSDKYKYVDALNQQFALSEAKCRPLVDDALAYAKLVCGKAKPLTLLDRLFIQVQSISPLDEFWSQIHTASCCSSEDRPHLSDHELMDAIQYFHVWISTSFGGVSPVMVLLHLLTVLTTKHNRRRFMVIHGEPYAGKSTLMEYLARFLKIHRLVLLKEEIDKQLVYAKGKDLLLIDDANTATLDQLLKSRTILDGHMIVGAKKYEHESAFSMPPVICTTNECVMGLLPPEQAKMVSWRTARAFVLIFVFLPCFCFRTVTTT
jgi:hypothetical protein